MVFFEKQWVFTGVFVGIIVYISWHLVPETTYQPLLTTGVAGVAAIAGSFIGNLIWKK